MGDLLAGRNADIANGSRWRGWKLGFAMPFHPSSLTHWTVCYTTDKARGSWNGSYLDRHTPPGRSKSPTLVRRGPYPNRHRVCSSNYAPRGPFGPQPASVKRKPLKLLTPLTPTSAVCGTNSHTQTDTGEPGRRPEASVPRNTMA